MANISDYLDHNITIGAVKDCIVENDKEDRRRYLGFSQIGEDCWRALWYQFRWCKEEIKTPFMIMIVQDGRYQEILTAQRLRMLSYIELITENEKKEQIGYRYLSGHFNGHCDGHIKGILEAPKTWHIWEHKNIKEKKFEELKNLMQEHGEKQALEKWDYTYYCQAQMYMYASGFDRHYLTASTPGGRDLQSCRTELNKKIPVILLEKAKTIITSEKPLERMSKSREFYKCRWCRQKEICFDNLIPDANCRTCAFSEPVIDNTNDAAWKCYKHNKIIDCYSCEDHLYLNTLMPFKAVASDESGQTPNWIKYDINGQAFYNVNKKAKTIPKAINLTSFEIRKLEYFECILPDDKIKSEPLKKAKEEKETTKKIKGII